ncbi:hypothetical protein COHA_001694 [Chlorella ohadii]|uniref:PDZ domain-containing protein n=1 Tax=Chlorella ohadii TaxID=2649997 RepID=A0AAD5DYZ3_9CHLO|nr:hypothetical protein COHA_001694 [Chlorella ohadii]
MQRALALGRLGMSLSTGPAGMFGGRPPVVEAVPVTMENKTPLPDLSQLSPDEILTIELFKTNTPSVVNIANIALARHYYSTDVLKIPQGQGSGFIWDTSGEQPDRLAAPHQAGLVSHPAAGCSHIVTNFHVIRGASEVQVSLIDQSTYPAKIVGGDPAKDVAVLQLQAPPEVLANLKPVSLGASSSLVVGQKVFAIGNPFGLDHSLSSGIISGLNRELNTGYGGSSLRNVIQCDAAINPGNSGGPLLDSRGRLIGINTAIADPTGKGASSGIGFAIPIDTVRGLVEQILKYGRVVRPVLGITIAPPQALRQMGLEGVLVMDVPPGTPADKAGMQGIVRDGFGRLVLGDVIVGMNGRPVKKEADLFDILDGCKVGDTVNVEVLRRGGQRKVLSVQLAERQPETTE